LRFPGNRSCAQVTPSSVSKARGETPDVITSSARPSVIIGLENQNDSCVRCTGPTQLSTTASPAFDGASGSNTYSGGTTFRDGIVDVSSDANLGATSGPLTFNGGDLRWNASFDLAASRAIELKSNGGKFRTSNFDSTISQAITGLDALTKQGSGMLTLTGDNTYSGGTMLSGGTLSLNNSAATRTGTITVLGSTIDYADTINVANTIDLQNNATLSVSIGTATQTYPFMTKSRRQLKKELGG